jgi:transposase
MAEKRRQYTEEFKQDAVRLVTEHGYGVTEAARNLGINAKMLGRWKRQAERQTTGGMGGNGHMTAEHEELLQLRKEVKRLRMEREILKKATLFFVNESR